MDVVVEDNVADEARRNSCCLGAASPPTGLVQAVNQRRDGYAIMNHALGSPDSHAA